MFFNIFKKETSSDKVISIKLQEEQLNEFDRLVEFDSTNRNRVIKELMQLYIDKKVKFNFLDIEEKESYCFNDNSNNLIIGQIGKGKNKIFKNIINDLIYNKKIMYIGESEKEIGLLAFTELYNKKIYDYDKDGIKINFNDLIYLVQMMEFKNENPENTYFYHFSRFLLMDLITLLNHLSIEINNENIDFYLIQKNMVDLYLQYKEIKGFDCSIFKNIFDKYEIKEDLSYIENKNFIYCKNILNEIKDYINLKKGNYNIIDIIKNYDVILLRNNVLVSLMDKKLRWELNDNLSLSCYNLNYSDFHIIFDNVKITNSILNLIRSTRKYIINWSIYQQELNQNLSSVFDSFSTYLNIILLQNNGSSIQELKNNYKTLDFDNLSVLLDNLKLEEYYLFNVYNKTIHKYKNKIN